MSSALVQSIRILLVDDHKLVCTGVRMLLESHPELEVVGEAYCRADALAMTTREQPDLIVLDITMPILNGIDAVHELHEAGSTAKFVFLTIHQQPAFVDACFAEGALGYVTKSHLGTDLLPAVNAALAGCRFISPSLPR